MNQVQCKRILSFQLLLFIQIVLLIVAFNVVAAFQGDDDEYFHQEYLTSRTVQLRTVELKVKQQQPNFDGYKARRKLKQQEQEQVFIEENFKTNVEDHNKLGKDCQKSIAPNWWLGPGNIANQYLVILAAYKIPKEFKKLLQQTLDNQGTVLSFIPNGTYVIVSTPQPLHNILELENVLTITKFLPIYKISTEVSAISSSSKIGNLMRSSFVSAYEGVVEGHLVLKVEIIQGGLEWIDIKIVDDQIQTILGGMCGPVYMGMCQWETTTMYNYGTTRVPLEILGEVAVALAELPFVHWIEGVERMQVMNFFANSIVQGGTVGLTTTHRPFWDAGLTGAGQLVGVGDTGLDFDSCFFRDSNVSQPGPDHRKVMAYRTIGDQLDGSGHGTHVCGTISGSVAEGRAQNHNGLAPDSKIAFTDLGTGRDKFLKLPEEGMERYYRWGYDMGVRVHSDSWGGGPSGGYRQTSRDADRFMWEHPDFLAILAAGNEGEAYGEQATINSLAACKNAVAVGATLGPFGTLPTLQAQKVYFKTVQPPDIIEVIKGVKADFGPRFEDVLQEPSYQITSFLPITACINSTQQLQHDYRGKIVLVSRGECKYLDKVLAAQEAGAVGIIIYNIQEQRYGYSSMMIPQALKGNTTVYIPAANVPLSTAEMLLRHLNRTQLHVQVLQSSVVEKNMGVVERFDNIAKFSSFGPTDDDRVKPDLVAPGEAIRSAYGDGDLLSNNCQTAQLTGTSMATPIVAGAALLVRQYFVDGFYPSQSADVEDSFVPSSALIKAVLINGAIDLKGVSEAGLPLENSPSIRQGWGRINLGSSLPLVNTSTFSLYVSDNTGLAQDENFYSCVKIPAYITDYPLTATLVWTDPPADLLSMDQILVNDLDLKIISPPGLPKSSRGAAPDPDRKNNVEQETVQQPVPDSSYIVLVSAFQVPWPRNDTNDQPFALVITGPPGMVVEECEGVCTTCPSSPTLDNSIASYFQDEAAHVSQANISLLWNQTFLEFDDPCLCSENGVDAITGIDSMRRGCARHALEFGVEMRYCYVLDSVGCGAGAYASRRIPGVAWRECNLFEEMYSMAVPWVPLGADPSFVQDEDMHQMNLTQDVILEVEEFEKQILNLTVILEPISPSILVPMDSTVNSTQQHKQEIQTALQMQQLSSSQTPDQIYSFQNLFNVTWQVNQNYNDNERAYGTNFSQSPEEFQDELSLLQLQVSPLIQQENTQNQQQQQYQQLQYQQYQVSNKSQQSVQYEEQPYSSEMSGLAAIQAFQYNPRNFTIQIEEDPEIGTQITKNTDALSDYSSQYVRDVNFQEEPVVEVFYTDNVLFVPIESGKDNVPVKSGTQDMKDVASTIMNQFSKEAIGGRYADNFSQSPPVTEVYQSDDFEFVPITPISDNLTTLNVVNAQNVQNLQGLNDVIDFAFEDVTFIPIAPNQDDLIMQNQVNVQNVQNSQDMVVDEVAYIPNTGQTITQDAYTKNNADKQNDATNSVVTSVTSDMTPQDVTQSKQTLYEDESHAEPIAEIQVFESEMVQYKSLDDSNQLMTVTVDIQTRAGPVNEPEDDLAPTWFSVWGVEEQQDNAPLVVVQQEQMQLLEGLIELAQVRDDFNG